MSAQAARLNAHDKRGAGEVRMLREDEVHVTPPSKWLLLAEGRVWAEYAAFLIAIPLLRRLPRGDGHPVMVIPGFGASDTSTLPLRRLLRRLGYAAHGWEHGRNIGMNSRIKQSLGRSLEALHERHGQTVSLIGWSLGGVYVREMARHAPQHVRQVITLGSPINGHPQSNNVDALYRLANRGKKINLDWEGFQKRRVPPPVPCTAIYSKSDGIVAWHCSREEPASHTECIGVLSSHFGLAVNPLVLTVIADRLAQPDGDWQPYRSRRWQQRLVHTEHSSTAD
jgi:pimeloyl-ACP methyl ester carboxylesterase